MPCPSCKTVELVMTERQGVEIDYCPACRGVWLDRGELDKIIDRTLALARPAAAVASSTYPVAEHRDRRHGHGDDHHARRYGEHDQHRHLRSFWRDLFD